MATPVEPFDAGDMGATDAWMSPGPLADLARVTFGAYFDPCAPPLRSRSGPLSDSAIAAFFGSGFFSREWPARLPAVINPPWSRTGLFVRHAVAHRPLLPMMLIAPARLDTQWSRLFDAALVLSPQGRLAYLDPSTGERPGSPRTSTLVQFRRIAGSERARAMAWAIERGWLGWRPEGVHPDDVWQLRP